MVSERQGEELERGQLAGPGGRLAGPAELESCRPPEGIFFTPEKQERNRALESVEFFPGAMWEISVLRDSCERKLRGVGWND